MTERRPPTQTEIVQLSPDDWEVLRDLKLFSLTEELVALEDPVSATQKYLYRSEEEWRTILSGGMSGGRQGETVMLFARTGDDYIGMVSSIIPDAQEGQDRVATVQHMYVREGQRRRGVGRELINSLLDNLRLRGDLVRAELEVVVTQTPAISLYESVGFVETGRSGGVIDWVENHLDEINMELDLR